MAGIVVLGTGAWGTTLAILMAAERARQAADRPSEDSAKSVATAVAPGETVVLWDHRPERALEMQRARENAAYLPGCAFPPNLHVTGDLGEAVCDRAVILMVAPSQTMRANARMLAPYVAPDAMIVTASKGLELGTRLRMSEVLAAELPPTVGLAALSGPNLAREIASGMPAAAVVAARDSAVAQAARVALTTPRFRIYTSDDVVGVELGGALKNIIALGVGISDGLGYGDNAKASFMTRALSEIARIALAAGANPLTLAGLAGLGDLIATCASPLSRNRALGLELARGRTLEDVLAERRTVAEGVSTTRVALEMARDLGVEMPITEQIAQVLFAGKDVRAAVGELMLREPKRELEGFGEG